MSALVEALYPVPDVRRTPLTLLRWWESRRLLYNQVVGTTGLFTLAALTVIGPAGGPPPSIMVQVAVVYGVLANVCYTSGWVLELVASWAWGRRAPDVGPLLFRQGLIFSVGLTLFPVLLAILFQLGGLAMAILR